MFKVPNYTETVSMKLSQVMADVGVNERIVLKRRRTQILIETITNIISQICDENHVTFFLGSQSEGTTAIHMKSDTDKLVCLPKTRMIQELSDWKPDILNLLTIENDSVSPGYCLLQMMSLNAPCPYNGEYGQYVFKDKTGKLLLKNSAINIIGTDGYEMHGPALSHQGQQGCCDSDTVIAHHCTKWPKQARKWLDQQVEGQWPSAEMKQYCSKTGCFVVAVGCSGSKHEELEWRISTSLAERCLMFNLNITQIRCYVLMKIICKSFIDPLFKDVISSFMCKNVLFHCVANTPLYTWRENNLLNCLLLCLYLLYNNIINENCPHFFIPGNNLMRGKISPAIKPHILEIVKNIINGERNALSEIKGDDIGLRFIFKFYDFSLNELSDKISGSLLRNLAVRISKTDTYCLLKDSSSNESLKKLKNFIIKTFNFQLERLDKKASHLMTPIYCATLGFVLASININQCNTVSADALKLISLGLNSDVASSRLKLASVRYCVQEIQKAVLVLSETERRYNLQFVEPVCDCYEFNKGPVREGFDELCDKHNEGILQYAIAFCVKFLPCEIHFVPNELIYEMFRSAQEDRIFRTKRDDMWMDCAVVDSLPYLYFLQYKVYSHLGKHEQKQAALSNLLKTINEEPHLGHRETALNILGKCMEQEGRAEDALHCYLRSLNISRRNNAATIHICILLSVLINART